MIRMVDLISPAYAKSQRIMHRDPRGYGKEGDYWAATVLEVAQRYQVGSILDYGSGVGALGVALRAKGYAVREYDPGLKLKAAPPLFADLVTCTDVLEHVEPDKLVNVLAHIRLLARRAAFLVISCRPAGKMLPNGHNAHLIIQPKQWWEAQLVAAGFTVAAKPTVLPEKMPSRCWMGVVTP